MSQVAPQLVLEDMITALLPEELDPPIEVEIPEEDSPAGMVTVGVNFLSVVHKKSGGVTVAFPDVCKSPAPVPYPNVAVSADSSMFAMTVLADGEGICTQDSNFLVSTGDEQGKQLGVISRTIQDVAEFVLFSVDVFAEMMLVVRAFDLMLHNAKNTPPFPLMQESIASAPGSEVPVCTICQLPL